jgi:CelD/BcsL family acetyltransferase involved in cellulose biosynthesis
MIQAVLICFHHKDTASYYQMGWAPDCPIESPGVILLSHSIEQAIAEGLRRYDFLRGDEAYKFRWTNTWTEQTTLLIGCSLSARAAITADRLKDCVKRAVSQCFGPDVWERARRAARSARLAMPTRSAAKPAAGASP